MRFYSTLISSALFFLVVCCTSCATKQRQLLFQQPGTVSDSAQFKQANSGSGTINYRIHSQDILQIRNLQSTKYIVDDAPVTGSVTSGAGGTASQGQTYQVQDDGTVALPVIGHIPVMGLTRAEAAKKIEDIYRKDLLKDPIIDLKIVNLKITLLGEVKLQGNFPLIKDQTNLVELLGEAGGLTDRADEKTIKIIRGDPKNPQITLVDLSKTQTLADPRIILQNNDIIYIAQNKRAVKNDQLQNVTTTLAPALLILNSALLIYTLIHH
ncbi:polysaccharide biosynthesis/export family protein [Mucilaginibacter sp. McL0603]|uniref:polysaccharide biosynthesis/export family protein n=1 Tax=Mucilaginibacter sp. McL0603 TaxID=3415670 RepID=UPI003CFA13FD